MKINSITPNFKGNGDVIIKYADGKNVDNPFINNQITELMNNLRKEKISATTFFTREQIRISSAPRKMIEALAKTDIVCRLEVGNKLKLIV